MRGVEGLPEELVGLQLDRELDPARQDSARHQHGERPDAAGDRPGEGLGACKLRQLEVQEGELGPALEEDVAGFDAGLRLDDADRRVEGADRGRQAVTELGRVVADEGKRARSARGRLRQPPPAHPGT